MDRGKRTPAEGNRLWTDAYDMPRWSRESPDALGGAVAVDAAKTRQATQGEGADDAVE
jgi:hypothetical protein